MSRLRSYLLHQSSSDPLVVLIRTVRAREIGVNTTAAVFRETAASGASAPPSILALRPGRRMDEKSGLIGPPPEHILETEVHGDIFLGPATEILHARLLAVAIKSAKGFSEPERKNLLDQWERVTFRIFGLYARALAKEISCF